MFQGFYLLIEDVVGQETCPDGWSGKVEMNTPLALVYFDETGMEFTTGEMVKEGNRQDGTERVLVQEFRLPKPCPVVAACSCPHCGKIVPTETLSNHIQYDLNCHRIREYS